MTRDDCDALAQNLFLSLWGCVPTPTQQGELAGALFAMYERGRLETIEGVDIRNSCAHTVEVRARVGPTGLVALEITGLPACPPEVAREVGMQGHVELPPPDLEVIASTWGVMSAPAEVSNVPPPDADEPRIVGGE